MVQKKLIYENPKLQYHRDEEGGGGIKVRELKKKLRR